MIALKCTYPPCRLEQVSTNPQPDGLLRSLQDADFVASAICPVEVSK
jgi:hypothetical protein